METQKAVKKGKKREKKRKHKKRSSRAESPDHSNSGSSSDDWAEVPAKAPKEPSPPPPQQRDAWMDIGDVIPTISAKDYKAQRRAGRIEEQKKSRALSTIDQPGQHERELNPYWKDGGVGVPMEKAEVLQEPTLVKSSVGDGGLKWLRRAYQRIQEQAADEGRSLEEVAAERYGSLDKLESLIREAEDRAGTSGRTGYFQRYRAERPRERGRMQRPDDEDNGDFSGQRSERRHDSSRHGFRHGGTREGTRESLGFQRPNEDGERKPSWKSRSHDHGGKDPSSKPSWMKKEFFKEPPPVKERATPEQDKQTQQDIKQPRQETSRRKPSPAISQGRLEEDAIAPERQNAPARLLSDTELNALGAKLIKAEMLGNKALYDKLKIEIEEARKARQSVGVSACPDGSQRGSRKEEVVVLMKTDSRGFSHPLVEPEQDVSQQCRKTKMATHNKDGERVRYFADDDRLSLKNMFEREKLTTAEDQNAEFARLAGKARPSTSQDYDFDDAALDKAAEHDSSAKQDARDRWRAIQEHKQMGKALDKCKYCLESSEMKKHLIIAIGIKTYLCLPAHQSLTEGHCLVVPQAHVAAGTLLDEDVWLEVQVFRKGLTRMFEDMGKDTVFMETAVAFRHHPHAYLECIPVPKEVGDMAPMYFKKAILECESEWAQNRKLVDLSKKGLRNSIPKGLPYFLVDFGLQSGFAHVIEDEKDFPSYFGREIVGGMLDLEPRLWLKFQHEKFDEQRKKVLEFTNWWKPYDWTERLKPQESP